MSSAPRKVLVAEDEPINARLLGLLLARLGLEFETVGDGSRVIEKLTADGSFSLVLMDMRMPVMDGPETARRIRAGEAGDSARAVPIVAISASADDDDRTACREADMDGFLAKPVSAKALSDLLVDLAPRSRDQGASGS